MTVCLRSHSAPLLEEIVTEINNFCNTKHPLYSGTNRTKKAIMNGDKGSINFQFAKNGSDYQGKLDGTDNVWYLSFEARNATKQPPPPAEDDLDPDVVYEPPPPEPTLYEGFHQIYSGLVKEIALETAMCCIEDKVQKDMPPDPLLLLVDPGDTSVHQIYAYPGTKPLHVQLRDVVDGKPLPIAQCPEMFIRVDPYRAITEIEYFLKEVAQCEALRTRRILEDKLAPVKAADLSAEELKKLPPKEYLYRTVLPALLPGLQVITRDRPPDPVLWLGLYLLRHPKQYSKVLSAGTPQPAG